MSIQHKRVVCGNCGKIINIAFVTDMKKYFCENYECKINVLTELFGDNPKSIIPYLTHEELEQYSKRIVQK